MSDPVDVAVGQRIRLMRKLRNVSQEALAQACGITFQQIQKYERGDNRVSASMLTRIAKHFGVPVAEFFGESDTTLSPEMQFLLDFAGDAVAYKAMVGFKNLNPQSRRAIADLITSLA